MLTPPSHQTERNDMSDRKSPKDKGSGQAPQPKTGAVTPVPAPASPAVQLTADAAGVWGIPELTAPAV